MNTVARLTAALAVVIAVALAFTFGLGVLVLFMGLLGAILALTGSFLWLAVVSTLARLFVYAGCIAALPRA